jgi:hypothetical protein
MKVSEFNLQAQNTETCTTETEWHKHISKDVQWFRETKKIIIIKHHYTNRIQPESAITFTCSLPETPVKHFKLPCSSPVMATFKLLYIYNLFESISYNVSKTVM